MTLNYHQVNSKLSPSWQQSDTKLTASWHKIDSKQPCHQVDSKLSPSWQQAVTKLTACCHQVDSKLPPRWQQAALPPSWQQSTKLTASCIEQSASCLVWGKLCLFSKLYWHKRAPSPPPSPWGLCCVDYLLFIEAGGLGIVWLTEPPVPATKQSLHILSLKIHFFYRVGVNYSQLITIFATDSNIVR